MPDTPLTDTQRAFIRGEAESAAQVIATATDEQLETLLAAELVSHTPMVLGVKMIAEDRGWTLEQFYKALLYANLRQHRAVRESKEK
jgi:hypothetical protein